MNSAAELINRALRQWLAQQERTLGNDDMADEWLDEGESALPDPTDSHSLDELRAHLADEARAICGIDEADEQGSCPYHAEYTCTGCGLPICAEHAWGTPAYVICSVCYGCEGVVRRQRASERDELRAHLADMDYPRLSAGPCRVCHDDRMLYRGYCATCLPDAYLVRR